MMEMYIISLYVRPCVTPIAAKESSNKLIYNMYIIDTVHFMK